MPDWGHHIILGVRVVFDGTFLNFQIVGGDVHPPEKPEKTLQAGPPNSVLNEIW